MKKEYIIYNKKLINEWDYSKNNQLGLNPTFLTSCSNKKAWWICSAEHSWQATINNRNKGSGCPYCSGRIAIKGVNDLLTKNPLLAKEWNYVKNGKLSPQDFTISSDKKVWWTCSKGHEWQATIDHRNKGSGCPYCKGRKIMQGYNDLKTVKPELLKDWCYELNSISPDELSAGSHKAIWWKCHICGHKWNAKIYSRVSGSGCPNCAKNKRNF